MSTLPSSGSLGGTPTNAQFQGLIEDLRDFIVETVLGASARYALTIASGSVTPPDGATGGGGVFTLDTEAAAASDDLTNVVQTNTHDGQIIILQAVSASRVVTVKHAAGGTGDVLLYDSADFVLDALDKWVMLQRRSTQWVEIRRAYGVDYYGEQDNRRVAQLVSHNTLCPHSRLRIDRATAATLTIAADAVVLADSSGHVRRYNTLSETLTISSTGANGRDVVDNAGSEQASSWYHLFAIGKADGTLDVFASQVGYPGSGTSIYTRLPSGYTFAGYLGAIYNNSSADLVVTQQRGDKSCGSVQTALSLGTQTSYTSVTLIDVPVTARKVVGSMLINSTNGSAVSIDGYVAAESASELGQRRFTALGLSNSSGSVLCPIELELLTAQTLYYKVAGTGGRMTLVVTGWEF